jgi:alpha-L-rhamnosidase
VRSFGNGWYRGQIGFQKHRNHYGNRLALLAQLDVTFADGSREDDGIGREMESHDRPDSVG